MLRKVVLVNQSSGFLVVDDLNSYCKKYDKVCILCANIAENERKLNPAVSIDHICAFDKSSSLKRIFTWLGASIQIFVKLLFKYHDYDIVYYTNPPMACFASIFLKNKFKIVVYDIYPDALQTIGISKTSLIYRIWSSINKKLFAKAERIFTLSEGMKEALCKYCIAEKIYVVPLWSSSDKFKPIKKKNNPFIKAHNIEDKFIVLYSGNIGYTHSVECLIDIAKKLKNETDILFLIIGEGKKKKELVADVEKLKLENVKFLPFQDFSVLPYSLASSDLAIITLDDNVSRVSVPSKTFDLLAVGSPLLAISTKETEMYRLIEKYNNGKCIPKQEIDMIVEFIRQLKNSPLLKKQYGNNSLLASRDFTYINSEMYVE